MTTETLSDLLTKRAALDVAKTLTSDPKELRSIAAQRAHVTRRISKFETTTAAAFVPVVPVAPAADAPLSPEDIIAETKAMLAKFGKDDWSVKMSPIATKMYGCADFAKREVRISAKLAAVNPAARTRNTIAHEVAHVIAGYAAGHGAKWKEACALTGAEPKACYSSADVTAVPSRFVGKCKACGEQVGTRNKAPRTNGYQYHRATGCSAGYRASNFDRRLVWTDTRTGREVTN